MKLIKGNLSFLYKQSNINSRYSVIEDFGKPSGGSTFFKGDEDALVNLEKRLQLYDEHATPISVQAIQRAIDGIIDPKQITHLITVSCTGMSAPGLDLTIAEALDLDPLYFAPQLILWVVMRLYMH